MSLEDPRWLRLMDADYACSCCGRNFGGLFDIAFDHPDAWPHGNRAESGQNVLAVGDDRLGSDLCRLGEHRFIRGTLLLPIKDTDQTFAYGVWGSVAPASFDAYVDFYDSETGFEGCFAWLGNILPGWGMDDALPCDLLPGSLGQRPSFSVHSESGHPLADAQDNGIDFERLLDVYADAGQDIRPHLGEV